MQPDFLINLMYITHFGQNWTYVVYRRPSRFDADMDSDMPVKMIIVTLSGGVGANQTLVLPL